MVRVRGDLDRPDKYQRAILGEQLDHLKSVPTLGWFKQLVFSRVCMTDPHCLKY